MAANDLDKIYYALITEDADGSCNTPIWLAKAIASGSSVKSAETNLYANDAASGVPRANVGDTVFFGAYEQDADASEGKKAIEWLVLAKEGNRALVISKYALDVQPYNTKKADVTWETCTLRKWLNGEFLNSAFTAEEQAKILDTNVPADKNPIYDTNSGNATTDKVFLLSINEVKKYFSSDSARQCKATDYAVANCAYVYSDSDNCFWWLRSPGDIQFSAADVLIAGSVNYRGDSVRSGGDCVRPTLWINLGS